MGDDKLLARLVRAVVEACHDGDPVLNVAIAPGRIEVSWEERDV